jgi:hypothetical protein
MLNIFRTAAQQICKIPLQLVSSSKGLGWHQKKAPTKGSGLEMGAIL